MLGLLPAEMVGMWADLGQDGPERSGAPWCARKQPGERCSRKGREIGSAFFVYDLYKDPLVQYRD